MLKKLYIFARFPLTPSLHSRVKTEEDSSDLQDLVMSFTAIEEKVLEQYTYAKVLPKCILNLYGIYFFKATTTTLLIDSCLFVRSIFLPSVSPSFLVNILKRGASLCELLVIDKSDVSFHIQCKSCIESDFFYFFYFFYFYI